MTIQARGTRPDIGRVVNGNLPGWLYRGLLWRTVVVKILEVEKIEIGKMGDDEKDRKLNFDIVDDMVAYLRNDPMCYRKKVFPLLDKHKFKNSPELQKEMETVVKRCAAHYIKKYNIPYGVKEVLTNKDVRTISKAVCDEETRKA